MLKISVTHGSKDHLLFQRIINQGIDSRLEAFTVSTFGHKFEEHRLYLDFADDEIQILLRRLLGDRSDEADQWVSDIVMTWYGYEGV